MTETLLLFGPLSLGDLILAESYLRPYLPVLIYLLIVVATGAAMLGLSVLLGPKRQVAGKGDPYECGMPLFGNAREKFSVRFYLVAILFVLFDIETVFLIPWAVTFREMMASLGFFVIAEMLVFIGILVLGLVYAWKRGALDWE